jgi:hypothetical protein
MRYSSKRGTLVQISTTEFMYKYDTSELSFKICTCKGFTDLGRDFFTFFMTIYTFGPESS